MLKLFAMTLLVSLSCIFSVGQSNAEFFAGYSLLRTNYDVELPNPPTPVIVAFDGDQTMHGVNVSATGYLRSGFGITGDFSWHLKKLSTPDPGGGTIDTNIQVYNMLGGVQYKFGRNRRVAPFVRVLAGVAHTRSKLTVTSLSVSDTSSSTDFAMALGGGLDIKVNDRIAVRAIQADYNPIFLRNNNELGFNKRADNFRVSFGIVFR